MSGAPRRGRPVRGQRPPRPRADRGPSRVGERFTAEVGPIAHGGHCVVRLPEPESRVVFVRHGVPGERVVLEITDGAEKDRFWRGDVVEVLEASEHRVEPPCPFAGPGRCGGCDLQHVALPHQRELKARVVREQMARLAKVDLPEDFVVRAVPGDDHGLRWRTRLRLAVAPDGTTGLRAHRSRRVVAVDDCRIAHPDARVEVTAGSTDSDAVLDAPGGGAAGEPVPGAEPAPTVLEEVVTDHGTRTFAVAADGFWQVHPGAPRTLVETVLDLLAPQPGERALDLYAGVGLFAAFLGDAVGERGRVVAVEGDRTATGHARTNLRGLEGVRVEQGRVDRVLGEKLDEPFDLVVLDPPREGAKRQVVEQVVDRAPRAVAYVSCDPAGLARDVATFVEHGYRLTDVRAFDLFPMTHHVECVALLTKTSPDLR